MVERHTCILTMFCMLTSCNSGVASHSSLSSENIAVEVPPMSAGTVFGEYMCLSITHQVQYTCVVSQDDLH